MSNIKLNANFRQVCTWPATIVGKDSIQAFEQFMLDELGTRVQYLEEIQTAPDRDADGYAVRDTGGRNDVLFAVHDEDVMKFAIPRLQYGMRWLEDVYGNGDGALYPERVAEYQCWETA